MRSRSNGLGAEYTFGEIDARSNRVAQALIARGLERGDRLCVYLANRIELIDLYLACVKLGVIFVPINILYREREISHILSDAEPKLLVTEAELPGLLDAEAGASQPDWLPASARWRFSRGSGLHLGHHGNQQGRDSHAQ